MVATRGGGEMIEIGVLAVNVPNRRVMLCAACEDEECVMAERYLDRHDVPYNLVISEDFRGDTIVVAQNGLVFSIGKGRYNKKLEIDIEEAHRFAWAS